MPHIEEADKENRSPITETATSSQLPLTTASTTPRTSTKTPLAPASHAFPSSDEADEDRDGLATDGKTLRSKRSALFYPSASLRAQSNQKPFSRSAARRNSIMALGSIGYLQHLYTKQGIASRKRPLTKGAMTLAIGHAGEALMSSSAGTSDETRSETSSRDQSLSSRLTGELDEDDHLSLPPSPEAGSYALPKYLDLARPLEADADALRKLLVADLVRLTSIWGLEDWLAQDPAVTTLKRMLSGGLSLEASEGKPVSTSIDLLASIDVTTKAIRSVRSYILAFPQRSRVPTSLPIEPSGRDLFRRQISFSGVSRPGQVGTPVPTRTCEILHHTPSQPSPTTPVKPLQSRASSQLGEVDTNHLGTIRRAALEVLSALKEMEIRHRTESISGNEDEHETLDTAADTDGSEVVPSADADASSVTMLVNAISATGYLYRSDLQLSDLAAERKTLQEYLVTVDSVLSTLTISAQEQRRLSSSANASLQDAVTFTGTSGARITVDATDTITASQSTYGWMASPNGSAERLSSFLIDHCEGCGLEPPQRLERIRDAAGDPEKLLALLSDGYVLCRVFNEEVRRSDKPWGYISAREMHDLEAEEAALLEKETLRAKEAQEAEAIHFQTRASRISPSEGASSSDGATPHTNAVEGVNRASRPGWTFRKTENLRVWATALKLRYAIQTTATRAPAKPVAAAPTYGSLGLGKLALHGRRVASESHAPSDLEKRSSRTIDFDPVKVARHDPGWQEMLTKLIHAWIDAVAREP